MTQLLGFGDGHDGVYSSAGNATWGTTPTVAVASVATVAAGGVAITISGASSFADGDLVMIHQTRGTGAGQWELNRIVSGGGTTSLTLAIGLSYSYTDSGASQAQIVEIKEYSKFTQNSGHTLTDWAWNGNINGIMGFVCNGLTTIAGLLTATGKGFLGGTATFGGNSGEGTAGAVTAGQRTANGNGGGCGNGSNNSGGGGANGGAGLNGENDPSMYGLGGSIVGNAELTLMDFGGGGGSAEGTGGNGGNGGGIIIIISNQIAVTGTVVSGGNNGTVVNGWGGGGGGGGSILIIGRNNTIGTNLVTAPYGTGGIGTYDGGRGGVGRIRVQSCSLSGSSTGASVVTGGFGFCGSVAEIL